MDTSRDTFWGPCCGDMLRKGTLHIAHCMATEVKAAAGAGKGVRPSVERLAAAGLLAKWVGAHTSAGGTDPRFGARSHDLVAKGVPLASAAGKVSKSCPLRARGAFSYANARVGKGLDRATRRSEMARLFNEFNALPADQKKTFELEERQRSIEKSRDEGGMTPDQHYDAQIGDQLWQMSTRTSALSCEVLEDAVEATLHGKSDPQCA